MNATAHIFVYGTLLPGARDAIGVHERARLAAESNYLGAASLPGRLYDLGAYPGLVETGVTGDDFVRGGVYAMPDPAATLAWLDDYEGLTGGPDDEYRRELRRARLDNGAFIMAHAYIHIGPVVGKRLVENGNWLARGL